MRSSLLQATTAALLLPLTSAMVAHFPRAAAPSPWVTVDDVGRPTTITPTVTTINGGSTSTISPAPDYVTRTGTWTLTIAGTTITSTGTAPTATPTGSGKAGAFVKCENYQQVDAPFCMPHAGAAMYPGKMYYITWDTDYFGDPNTPAEVLIEHSSGTGLKTAPVPGGQGFTTFTFTKDFLSALKVESTEVTFTLVFGGTRDPGPTVLIKEQPPAESRSTAALLPIIILPAILGAMLLGLLGFCIWSYKKNERWPLFARVKAVFGRGRGYGARQSHGQRTSARMSGAGEQRAWPGNGGSAADRKETNVGVELTDRDSWSPTSPGGGRNVFREEMARQERDGT